VDSSYKTIAIAARHSSLSRAQVKEIHAELIQHHPFIEFNPIWMATTGDLDLETPLRTLDKTDFFTKEIDALQLNGGCRISIHSAKDLAEPLASGLCLVALTAGKDPADSLVLREKETLSGLKRGASIGVSSQRREQALRALRLDWVFVDVRGSIDRRLWLLDTGAIDGLVVAEAALIRLQYTHRNRMRLPGPSAPLQGRLAVLAREDDEEMKQLFACIDAR